MYIQHMEGHPLQNSSPFLFVSSFVVHPVYHLGWLTVGLSICLPLSLPASFYLSISRSNAWLFGQSVIILFRRARLLVCLSVACWSVCLSVACLSVACLSVACLSVCLSVCLSLSLCFSLCLPVCTSVGQMFDFWSVGLCFFKEGRGQLPLLNPISPYKNCS